MSAYILGLDSSLTAFGWCVLGAEADSTFAHAGLIRTEKNHDAESANVDTARRCHDIATELERLFSEYHPSLVGIESLAIPFGKTSGLTVSRLGRVRGIVDGLCAAKHVECIEITAQNLKAFATGDRKAEKDAMVNAALRQVPTLERALGETRARLRDNLADAAHVARWARQRWNERRAA